MGLTPEHLAFSGSDSHQQKPAAEGHQTESGLPSSDAQQHVQDAPAAFSFGSPAAAEHAPAGKARPRAPSSPRRAGGQVSSPRHAASRPQPAVWVSPPAAGRPPEPFQFAAPSPADQPQKHSARRRAAPSGNAQRPDMAQQPSWSAAGTPWPPFKIDTTPGFPGSTAQQDAQAVPPFQAPAWRSLNAEGTLPHHAAVSNPFTPAHVPGFTFGAGAAPGGSQPHHQPPPPPPAAPPVQFPRAFAFGQGAQHTGSAPKQPGAGSAAAAAPGAAAGTSAAGRAWGPFPWPKQPSSPSAGAFSFGQEGSWAGSRPEHSQGHSEVCGVPHQA